MLLEVEGVTKAFGGVPALVACSIAVDSAEPVGLIGPNGAGKSTLIEVISGFQTAAAGRIRVGGVDISGLSPHVVASHGLLRTFQLARVWGRLTVLENLLVVGSETKHETVWQALLSSRKLRTYEGRQRERARQILAEFDLIKHKDAPAERLSGGQKRILEFARIMMANPKIVLLDEPSASLSPEMSSRIGEGIRRMSAAGMAVLLVEHDLGLVESVANRVVVMAAGQVVAEGSLAQLRTNPIVVNAYLGTSPPAKPFNLAEAK
jgi:ABC-type branched-subunit amino acid transport system ATPase component